MTTHRLNEQAIDLLIGRKIIAANNTWIQLDNNIFIHLEESEIKHLNS